MSGFSKTGCAATIFCGISQQANASNSKPRKQTWEQSAKEILLITDNAVSIVSTSKVAIRPSQMGTSDAAQRPKPKRQLETQSATAESLNFLVAKVATKEITN